MLKNNNNLLLLINACEERDYPGVLSEFCARLSYVPHSLKTVNASSSFKKGTDQTGDVANIAPPFLGIKGLKVVLKTPIKHKRKEKLT